MEFWVKKSYIVDHDPSGIALPCPDSQMEGLLSLDFAISFDKNQSEAAQAEKDFHTIVDIYNQMPFHAMKLNNPRKTVPYRYSMFTSKSNDLILSTVKKAEITVETFEISDGGEGTISALKNRLDGELITFETVDLLQRHMVAKYLFVNKTAIIESAEVIGIDKIVPTVEPIQKAGTFGLGALFIDAKNRGDREIILSLGGTGTSDGGIGRLKAL